MLVWATVLLINFILKTNASSNLTNAKSNISRNVRDIGTQNGTDVFRQLLNQETLIRMSLSKNVHTLMSEVVELKEKQIQTESKITGLQQENKVMKLENEMLKKEINKLKDKSSNHQKLLVKVDQKLNETDDDILQITEEQQAFKTKVQKWEEEFEKNTSEVLKDLKIELRYMSVTLLNLNKHTLEIDKGIPKLVENNFRRISEHVNKSIETFASNLTYTQTEQRELLAAVTELNVFQSNISTLTTESIHEIKKEMHQTHDTQLKQAAAISALEVFKINISSRLQTKVGFTAGHSSTSSGWSSGILVFDKIIYDIGGGYNAGTGVFTAPVGGDYVFYVTIVSYSTNTVYVDIVLNGNRKVKTMSYTSGGSSYQTGTNMVLLRLKQGDRVWVKHYSGSSIYSDSSDSPLTTFSGFLL